MGLFNRKKKSDDDINDYYASERRQRVGVAWMLGLATLVVTVLLALGLFYGGRFVYRTVFDNDNEPAVTQEDEQDQPVAGTEESSDGDDSNRLLDSLDIGENEENASDDEDASTPSPASSDDTPESDSQDNLPSSGPAPETLPSTGPSGPEELR